MDLAAETALEFRTGEHKEAAGTEIETITELEGDAETEFTEAAVDFKNIFIKAGCVVIEAKAWLEVEVAVEWNVVNYSSVDANSRFESVDAYMIVFCFAGARNVKRKSRSEKSLVVTVG